MRDTGAYLMNMINEYSSNQVQSGLQSIESSI